MLCCASVTTDSTALISWEAGRPLLADDSSKLAADARLFFRSNWVAELSAGHTHVGRESSHCMAGQVGDVRREGLLQGMLERRTLLVIIWLASLSAWSCKSHGRPAHLS